MYLQIAPAHLFGDDLAFEGPNPTLRNLIRASSFWIKVKDHPKDTMIITQVKRKKLYRGNVMEMYKLLDVSPRAPHNRKNK